MPRKTHLEGEGSEGRTKTSRRRTGSSRAVGPPAAVADPKPEGRFSVPAGSAFERMNRPTEEEIRMRAYMIYLSRNGAPGDPVADWLQAERELNALMRGEPLPRADSRG